NFVYRGDLVGESALKPNATRVADVVANKDSTLFEFNREELANAFSKHSDLSDLFEEEVSLRRKTLILSHCPPFSLLTLSERAIVAEQSIEMDVPNGAIIKKEGAHLPYSALVISGEIESYFTADTKPNYSGSLYANTLFGLGELYLDEAIPHKLVAKKDVKLLKIPHKVVEDASEAHVDFETVVSGIASTNYAQTMETIRILSSNPATN
ncbi:cyclic nucleotide-binding domain-containing protein, partial [Pseudomonadota bacterium]